MKVLIQRVCSSDVNVYGKTIGKIDQGLLLLVGFGRDDVDVNLERMAKRVVNLRIFSDDSGRFQYSVLGIEGGVLAVPQFTLYGDTRKGRRPDFTQALEPTLATKLFDQFVNELRNAGVDRVETGQFGADMKVSLTNDGPVTLMLES